MTETLDQILSRLKAVEEKERKERTDRALKPIRDDAELGKNAESSSCDFCGKEEKLKIYPCSVGNALICHSCHTKEGNWLRMNFQYDETNRIPAWYTLKWYNLTK